MSTSPPAPPRSAEEQARLERALTKLFEEQITFNQVLGLKVVRFGPSGPVMRFDMRPELVGSYMHGRLHGGVISAVLDTTGGMVLVWAIAQKHAHEPTAQVMHRFVRFGTIDLRVDYLRPGRGKHFIATARIVRRGSRIAVTHMELHNDEGKLIATGGAAYVVG
jgi:uncharacterized protein (TIGR00369 family)